MSQYARFIIADVFDGLASLPDNSVDLIITSPPFLALRSYLPADSPLKAKEIGSEATPGEFIDKLLDVVEACDRVLAPHGTLVVELGDTYSGSGGAGGDYLQGGWREGQRPFDGSMKHARIRGVGMAHPIQNKNGRTQGGGRGWPIDKSLCMIPQSFQFALAYGFNPFTARETPRWRVRNVHPWLRPNPPVGALGDKWRPATSYLVSACKSKDRWFDLDAVRTPSKNPIGVGVRPTMARVSGTDEHDQRDTLGPYTVEMQQAGAPPLDWILQPTEAYSGSHYATWPRKLVIPFVESMCPRRVCEVCGEPSRRIVERESAGVGYRRNRENVHDQAPSTGFYESHRETVGWTDCGHDAWRPGVVLDPFVGRGATVDAAFTSGRSAIGIDIDARNAELARQRCGMWLEVEELIYPSEEALA